MNPVILLEALPKGSFIAEVLATLDADRPRQ